MLKNQVAIANLQNGYKFFINKFIIDDVMTCLSDKICEILVYETFRYVKRVFWLFRIEMYWTHPLSGRQDGGGDGLKYSIMSQAKDFALQNSRQM